MIKGPIKISNCKENIGNIRIGIAILCSLLIDFSLPAFATAQNIQSPQRPQTAFVNSTALGQISFASDLLMEQIEVLPQLVFNSSDLRVTEFNVNTVYRYKLLTRRIYEN